MTSRASRLEVVDSWNVSRSLESILASLGPNTDWYKLPRHVRSRCLKTESAYVYVKGWEPLAAGFPELLRSLRRTKFRGSTASFLTHFSTREQKIPAALRLHEGLAESSVALHLQARSRSVTGARLNTPDPIALLKFSADEKERLRKNLAAHLDAEGREQCESILKIDDVAVYVYEQDSPPHRLEDYMKASTWSVSRGHYPGSFEPEIAARQWIYLLLFFLSSDVLPFHEEAAGLGSPFDIGNLCLSGGVADVGTCMVGTETLSPEFVRRSIEMTGDGFCAVLRTLLKVEPREAASFFLDAAARHLDEHPYLAHDLVAQLGRKLERMKA